MDKRASGFRNPPTAALPQEPLNGIYGFDKKYTALYVDITWRFDSNAHEQQREKIGQLTFGSWRGAQ